MEIRNVVIRDEDGNTLQPQTSFAGVVDADAKRLDEWRKEVDAALSSAGGSVDTETITALQEKDEELSRRIDEVEGQIPDISGLASTDDVDERVEAAKEWTGVWQMGNFATLAAATLNLAYHEVYNNPDRRIISFTVGAGTTGIVVNQTFNPTSGLPYTARQYLYFDGHRYVRTVQRQSNGDVTSPSWTLDDGRGVFPGKGVMVSRLLALTEGSTSEQVQEALTYPNGDGVLTRADLETCISTGLSLVDYDTNSPVTVGRTKLNGHYVLTYVGYTTVTASYAPDYEDPVITSVFLDVTTEGEYSVFKAPNLSGLLREDDERLPVQAYIPGLWRTSNNTSETITSAGTILSYFGCTTVEELLARLRKTSGVHLLYLNSGSSFYWVPAHFVEVINSNNTVHIVTIMPNPLDADKAARLECVMNLDGTVAEGSSNNIFVKYTPLVTQEAFDELAARVTTLEGQE